MCVTHSSPLSTVPTGAQLCSNGTATPVSSLATQYTWTCLGVNGGNADSCSATRQAACKDLTGQEVASRNTITSSYGCAVGTIS